MSEMKSNSQADTLRKVTRFTEVAAADFTAARTILNLLTEDQVDAELERTLLVGVARNLRTCQTSVKAAIRLLDFMGVRR